MEGFVVRPARPEDKEAVLAFCEHTWDEFGDYIADVWDEWLADVTGAFLVGELHGKPVAIGKVTALGPGEIWLEGLRVAPEVRKSGVANAYMAGQRQYLARLRPRVLRLATGVHNAAVHHIMDRSNFRRVATPLCFRGRADESIVAPAPQTLGPEEGPAVMALLERSEVFAAGHRLCAVGWRWPALTPARLAEHLRAGEVVGYRRADRSLAAVALTPDAHDFLAERGRLWVGLLDGAQDSVADLVRALRRKATATPDREVLAFVPKGSPWPEILEAAGYVNDKALNFAIFERVIRGRN
ncbi:MAG: GNAT family N-acetyltransferase [Chloroflexi bacterium]|nr:GNAT family N-acetyltransferase [Chloroflexota bacterium]